MLPPGERERLPPEWTVRPIEKMRENTMELDWQQSIISIETSPNTEGRVQLQTVSGEKYSVAIWAASGERQPLRRIPIENRERDHSLPHAYLTDGSRYAIEVIVPRPQLVKVENDDGEEDETWRLTAVSVNTNGNHPVALGVVTLNPDMPDLTYYKELYTWQSPLIQASENDDGIATLFEARTFHDQDGNAQQVDGGFYFGKAPFYEALGGSEGYQHNRVRVKIYEAFIRSGDPEELAKRMPQISPSGHVHWPRDADRTSRWDKLQTHPLTTTRAIGELAIQLIELGSV
jgi:hypothetical protein